MAGAKERFDAVDAYCAGLQLSFMQCRHVDCVRTTAACCHCCMLLFPPSTPPPLLGALLQYTYSGLRLEPESWHPGIASLKKEVEAAVGAAFNSCLLNFYRRWGCCVRLLTPLSGTGGEAAQCMCTLQRNAPNQVKCCCCKPHL